MKLSKDELRAAPQSTDAAGNKLEPEEQVIERRFTGTVPLTFNTGALITEDVPSAISVDLSAGDFANQMRSRCQHCAHFDQLGWQKLYHELRVEKLNDPNAQAFLNSIRAAADQATDEEFEAKHFDAKTGDIDLDHALMDLGLCQAMTEIWSSFLHTQHHVIVAPECGCPDDRGPRGEDLSQLYKLKNEASRRAGGRMHNSVMQLVKGAWKLVSGPRGR